MKNRSRLALAAIVASTALLLSACAGGDTEDTNGAATTPTGPFVIAADAVSTTLEPGSYDGSAHRYSFDMTRGPLLRYVNNDTLADGAIPGPSDVEPWLAESYEVTADGVEFTLGDAVSAAGNPLTPEDVVYTLNRVIASQSTFGLVMFRLAGIDMTTPAVVTGENTVKVNAVTNPLSLFVFENYWLSPLDSVEVEKHVTAEDPYAKTWLATNSAMYGPYAVGDDIGSFTPGEEIRFEANPNYTREDLAYQEVVLQAVPEIAGRISLLQSGQASQILNVSYENLKVLQDDPNLTIGISNGGSQDVLVLDNTVYSDPRVRQAVSYAIDREALNEGTYQGFGTPSTSVVSSVIPTDNSTADSYTFDLDKAKDLLEEADAVGTEMTIYGNATEMTAGVDSMLTTLQTQLTAAGFVVNVQAVASNADYRAGYAAGSYGAWIRGEGPLAADANYVLNLYYANGASSNFGKVNNQVLSDAVAASRSLTGEERDAAIAPGIESANEEQNTVPLVETIVGVAYSEGICPPPVSRSFALYPAAASCN